MEYSNYLENVKNNFLKNEFVSELDATMFYETQFELKWLVTKLKEFSYVSFKENVTLQDIKGYSSKCLKYSLRTYKGLPRGLQNGVVSFGVLVCNTIDQTAIDFAVARPTKHFAAFEMPIVMDLNKQTLYYYTNTPCWGYIYYKHFRAYIEKNFNNVQT